MPPKTEDAAQAVLTFLESVGRRAEAELYLDLFRRIPKESFALVAADPAVVELTADSLVERLRFLAELGLFAPVALGLFAPALAGRASSRLGQRLERAGLGGSVHDAADPGVVGALRTELRGERVPVIRFASRVPGDSAARFDRLFEIARGLESKKLVVLRQRGGIGRSGAGTIELAPAHDLPCNAAGISVINLRTDYERLTGGDWLDDAERSLLGHVKRHLDGGSAGSLLVSVASPLNVLRELFTVSGAGTLIKPGTAIECHASYGSVDGARLSKLFESSFGKRLRDSFLNEPPLAVYVEERYRGAAVLVEGPAAPFLTKFAVDRLAQGEGMGRDLWQAVNRDHPAVFWRARPSNPVAQWYLTLCDGMTHTPEWTVFWRGVDVGEVPGLVEWAGGRPADFT